MDIGVENNYKRLEKRKLLIIIGNLNLVFFKL